MGNLIGDYLAIKQQIDELAKQEKALKQAILEAYQNQINLQLADKDYNCGTANVQAGDYKLKFVVSKKVDYDQNKLANIYDQIIASGENPSDYMVIKYDVAESKFKAWPARIQSIFEQARTVRASTPTLTVEAK